MKRAPSKAYVRKGDHDLWYCLAVTHYGTEVRRVSTPRPTHGAALAHALAVVGLGSDPDPSRCPFRATDPITTRHPREDGWRCGYEAGHRGSHELFTSDGEDVLYAGVWVHPADLSPTNPEPTEAP